MTLNSDLMTKGEFAAFMGVSPGRVSQYIADRQIFGNALEGEGRRARIRVAVAQEQLRKTIDPGQRFGANGKALRGGADIEPAAVIQIAGTLFDQPVPPRVNVPSPPLIDKDVDELAQLRLRRERVKTEQAEEERKEQKGIYTPSVQARQEMAKAVAAALSVMDVGIQEMAEAVAARFDVPMRDVQQVLVRSFRDVREKRAKEMRASAEALPQYIEDTDDDDASQSGEDGV